jgi:hypothetical protein
MAVNKKLNDEELALIQILLDSSGVDLMEFAASDLSSEDGTLRLRDYQWLWYMDDSKHQISACSRDVGKSFRIIAKACGHVWSHLGLDIFISAPGADHLRPIADLIEHRMLSIRLLREALKTAGGKTGMTRIPSFQAEFKSGGKIVTRLPKQDGRGVKGQHAVTVIVEEGQDFPEAGYQEIYPTLRAEIPGAQMHVYGVTAGLNTTFDKLADDPDTIYHLHRKIAMERETWDVEQRKDAIKKYGSENSINYGRNMYGVSQGAHSTYYVIGRLMALVRTAESAWAREYNDDIYRRIDLDFDYLEGMGRNPVDQLALPGSHLDPQYISFMAGWDIGLTQDASEILIFGETKKVIKGTEAFRLLARIHMDKISSAEQIKVVLWLIRFYGDRFRWISMDKTGLGLPIWQMLDAMPEWRSRVRGYGFGEKLVVGWEDRPLKPKEKLEDIEIKKKTREHGIDSTRTLVDQGRLELPMDVDLLSQLQGVGQDHALDAFLLFGVGWWQVALEAKRASMKARTPVRARLG